MINLLAYLLVRTQGGTWSVGAYRNLEDLTSAWHEVGLADSEATGVVHVGFWRPNTDAFEAAAASKPGLVLLTGAARLALPIAYRSSSTSCALVDGLPLYVALSGWGYEKGEEECVSDQIADPLPLRCTPDETPCIPADWLSTIATDSSGLAAETVSMGIMSEALYQERESRLPSGTRDRLATFRFLKLLGHKPTMETMLEDLRFAPPWILSLDTRALDLPVRPAHRLGEAGAKSVSDIVDLGVNGLLQISGMGRKSIMDISKAIFSFYEKGSAFCDANAFRQRELIEREPMPRNSGHASDRQVERDEGLKETEETNQNDEVTPSSFKDALIQAFSLLNERELSVLRLRMGMGGSKKTLEEIAKEYSVTRERIRQIEAKAIKRVSSKMKCWETSLRSELARMLDDREMPLPLVGLEVLNGWFAGVESLAKPFEYVIEHFLDSSEFHVVKIGGQLYFTRLAQDEWIEVTSKAKALLSGLSKGEKAATENEARFLIDSLLVRRGEELRSILWETATKWAHFSDGPLGDRVLISVGMGAENLVEAILSDSDTPLHYSEIARRSAARGKRIEIRRAHHAAANVGLLLGRGIYGLEKHILLSEEEKEQIVSEVEDMLVESSERQWHASEIFEELEARGFDFGGRLSKYDINVVLGASTTLAYLGRMVWMSKSESSSGKADRMHVWQAVVSLLQHQGRPMRAAEIRERISRDRGLGSTFQIHQADPLIRVGENVWGLLWRDIPFSEVDAERIVSEMEKVLRSRGTGLHASEIVSALSETREIALKVADPITLLALAQRTDRMKAGKGGYIFPSDWEGPRRLTVSEAVEKAFGSMRGGGLSSEVARCASEALGREIPKAAVSAILMKIGVYDGEKGIWRHPEDAGGNSDEDSDSSALSELPLISGSVAA